VHCYQTSLLPDIADDFRSLGHSAVGTVSSSGSNGRATFLGRRPTKSFVLSTALVRVGIDTERLTRFLLMEPLDGIAFGIDRNPGPNDRIVERTVAS
jgi:hypothetical protein